MNLSDHPYIPTLHRAVGLACVLGLATACDDAPLELVEEEEPLESDAAASDTAAEATPANEAQDLELGGVGPLQTPPTRLVIAPGAGMRHQRATPSRSSAPAAKPRSPPAATATPAPTTSRVVTPTRQGAKATFPRTAKAGGPSRAATVAAGAARAPTTRT